MKKRRIKCLTVLTIIISVIQICFVALNLKVLVNQTYLIESSSEEANYSAEFLNIIKLIEYETAERSYYLDSLERTLYISSRSIDCVALDEEEFDTLRVKPSPLLERRMSAFTKSVIPYSKISRTGKLGKREYSPERRKLFIYLLESFVDLDHILFELDLSNVRMNAYNIYKRNIRGLKMNNSHLENMIFSKCNLEHATFENSDLINIDIISSNMRGANFKQSTIDSISFHYSLIPQALCFDGAEINHIDIKGAFVCDKDWLNNVKKYLRNSVDLDNYEISDAPTDTLRGSVPLYRISRKE